MSSTEDVYLGKSGQIYGPFSQGELDDLSAKGQLSQYQWIWSHQNQCWKSIESPPPHPLHNPTQPGPATQDWSRVYAIAFDSSHLLRGQLKWITETGCTLISEQKEEGPIFPVPVKIRLNLFDPVHKSGITLSVLITKIDLHEGHWNYHFRWEQRPELKKIL